MSGKYYQVEKILDKKITSSGVKYLIKWVGWPSEESTWEPLANLGNVMKMVNEFERDRKNSKEICHLSSDSEQGDCKTVKYPNKKIKTKPKSIRPRRNSSLSSETNRELSLSEDSPEKERVSIEGRIECDIPHKIVTAKLKSNKEVLCLIEWRKRYDGHKLENSWVSNKVLRNQYPLLLVDYYESKLQVKN